jgi:hypothetical protein
MLTFEQGGNVKGERDPVTGKWISGRASFEPWVAIQTKKNWPAEFERDGPVRSTQQRQPRAASDFMA